ncbi:MAG: 2-amino-4-hydroxy-6-hydroxymethyldihydropteridine diphosphokinase [Pseudomonadota bacterium]
MSETRTERFPTAIIALGGNLVYDGDQPSSILLTALQALTSAGLVIDACSRFFRTPAFPPGSGPDFVNASARLIIGERGPSEVLSLLHDVEAKLGRNRLERWAPRTCDLDLLALDDRILPDPATLMAWMQLDPAAQRERAPDTLVLPHPRLHERAFVLVPMCDVAPDWRHPVLGITVSQMLDALPEVERAEIVALEPGAEKARFP